MPSSVSAATATYDRVALRLETDVIINIIVLAASTGGVSGVASNIRWRYGPVLELASLRSITENRYSATVGYLIASLRRNLEIFKRQRNVVTDQA